MDSCHLPEQHCVRNRQQVLYRDPDLFSLFHWESAVIHERRLIALFHLTCLNSAGLTIFHDVNSKEPCTQVSTEPIITFFLKLKKMQSPRFNFMFISGPAPLNQQNVALLFWCVRITAGKSSPLIECVGAIKTQIFNTNLMLAAEIIEWFRLKGMYVRHHQFPTPWLGQGRLSLDQVLKAPSLSGLEQFQGWEQLLWATFSGASPPSQ